MLEAQTQGRGPCDMPQATGRAGGQMFWWQGKID